MESLTGASGGLAVRVAFACASAILLGLWLWRSGREGRESRLGRGLRITALALCGFWAATWLAIALVRLPYPYELEWCGGAMRDMAARTLHGQPLYVAPGPGWFPYEYPPLYLWASALLMKLFGGAVSFVPMRLISILSTLGSASLLVWWVRRLSGSRTWGLIATGLFLASFRFTGAWYDVERLDMLFLVLSLAGVCALQLAVEKDSVGWAVLAAAAHTFAFLTKQQAVLFVIGGVAALLWQRRWRLATAYGLATTILCAASVLALNSSTGGWFWYYCFRVPMANGIRANLARMYLTTDLPLFAPMIVLLAVGLLRRGEDRRLREDALLWCSVGMGLLGSFLSRAHWGGDQNVLMTGYVLIGTGACVVAGRWSRVRPRAAAPLFGLVVAQLIALSYRPGAQLPQAENRAAGDRYATLIRSLEREGPVLSLDHGAFTSTPRFHLMGLLDVAHTEKGLPKPLLEALRSHEYAAVVMDAKPETVGEMGEFARDYTRIENVGITESWVVTGFPTPSEGRSVWVLRP